jgi:demethylspheroidene O-methyltransferase
MDVGGGSGAFLSAVQKAAPKLSLRLFDLPDVAPQARARLGEGVELTSGSFKTDSLLEGADAISLIRVLYDHSDETVRDLLAKAYAALPAGGRLIISEPMTGGVVPHGPGNADFAFYCMAMQTGRARSAEEIAQLCTDAGFEGVRIPRAPRPFVTSVVEAVRPR